MKVATMKKSEVLRIPKQQRIELEEHFNVASLSIFGSVARDEANAGSDVDLLVEFSKPIGLFQFIELQQRLEELLGCKVDLGTPRSLKPRIREHVLQEAIRVA
jgi:predicted nucleotidyltransferase